MSSDIIIPHTAYKYNWRYARITAWYYGAPVSASRFSIGYIDWFGSKNLQSPVPQAITTTQGGDRDLLYGLPATMPGSPYVTNLNTGDVDKAKTTSRIIGYYHLNAGRAWHTYQFRIPVGQEVTYKFVGWIGDSCYYLTDGYIECELIGEVTS